MSDVSPRWLSLEAVVQHRSGGDGPNLRYLKSQDSIAGIDTLSKVEAYEVGRALARICHWMDVYMQGDRVRIDKLLPIVEHAIVKRPKGASFAAEETAETCERFMRSIFLGFATDVPVELQHEIEQSLTLWKRDVIAFAAGGGSRG